MENVIRIKKATPSDWGWGQDSLFADAVNYVQQIGHQQWTDHNTHDPGITILEAVSYAISEVGFRSSLPITDLLAELPALKTVYSAREILPNSAYTEADYRKLLIDLPGVRNAWLSKHPLHLYLDTRNGQLSRTASNQPWEQVVAIKGLRDVLLDIESDVDVTPVIKLARATLMANRNVGEDFVNIGTVPTQEFRVCAELELNADADVNAVLAQLYFEVQEYLAPTISNENLAQALEHSPLSELFDGPALACGFINAEDLAASSLRTEIRLSDVINILMDIPGIQSIRDIVITDTQTPVVENAWKMAVKPAHKAALSINTSRVVCYKRAVPMAPNLSKVQLRYAELRAELRQKNETALHEDFAIPSGVRRSVGDYHSVQHELPEIYGIGAEGLPPGSSAQRQREAQHLAAYLLIVDQLIANSLQQLADWPKLYSTDKNELRTYFYQKVVHGLSLPAAYLHSNPVQLMQEEFEDPTHNRARRNAFLDHLIARCGEAFNEYASVMLNSFSDDSLSVISDKCQFLKEYPSIGAERAKAYNYALKKPEDIWPSYNVSGLEHRIARLLGIRNYSRRNLSEVAYDIYAEIDTTPGDEFRFRVLNRFTSKILLSSSTHYVTQAQARAEMQHAIHNAQLAEFYQRRITSDGRHYFNIVDSEGEVIARRIEYFASEELMEAAIDALLNYLQEYYAEEGMYLIENLLLLPDPAPSPEHDEFLPVCIDDGCSDCADHDPYSFRVHFVLPAFAGRFTDMHFRDYAERVIREETPAHLLPKICWVSQSDMAAFEIVYRDWLEIKCGAKTGQRKQKWRAMIDTLYQLKNIYPTERLHTCANDSGPEGGDDTEQGKFIVGRTSLGSSDISE